MSMTHSEIIKIVAKWLKRHKQNIVIYNYPLVLSEFVALTHTGETPDVIGWNYFSSIVIEVKTSRQDFLRDKKKRFRVLGMGMGDFKYYCCPDGIIKVDDLPNGWGLLYVTDKGKIEIIQRVDKSNADLHAERSMLLSVIRRFKANEQPAT